jgi:hypothetical protein
VVVQASFSGAFINLDTGGYLLNLTEISEETVELRRGDFVEVATAMLTTYVSYGACKQPRE